MTMKIKKLLCLIASSLMGASSLLGCSAAGPGGTAAPDAGSTREVNEMKAKQDKMQGDKAERAKEKAYLQAEASEKRAAVIWLAGGCFWGTEAYFQRLPGVLDTEAGYANGKSSQTSYHELNETGHAETVKITYDPAVISAAELLDRFYLVIDPLSLNKQGNDRGTQYRTGIYYTDDFTREVAALSLELLNERLGAVSCIELQELKNYVRAEEYHQDYLQKEPFGYCHIDLGIADKPLFPIPEQPSDEELKKTLSPELYHIAREEGTERAFTSELNEEERPGVYLDALSGQVLFSSRDKFDAGCGWPSFSRGITTDALRHHFLSGHIGGADAEIRTANDGAHLGHVFTDGRGDNRLRYCINGLGLRFVPEEKMREEGLAQYLPYLLKPAQ